MLFSTASIGIEGTFEIKATYKGGGKLVFTDIENLEVLFVCKNGRKRLLNPTVNLERLITDEENSVGGDATSSSNALSSTISELNTTEEYRPSVDDENYSSSCSSDYTLSTIKDEVLEDHSVEVDEEVEAPTVEVIEEEVEDVHIATTRMEVETSTSLLQETFDTTRSLTAYERALAPSSSSNSVLVSPSETSSAFHRDFEEITFTSSPYTNPRPVNYEVAGPSKVTPMYVRNSDLTYGIAAPHNTPVDVLPVSLLESLSTIIENTVAEPTFHTTEYAYFLDAHAAADNAPDWLMWTFLSIAKNSHHGRPNVYLYNDVLRNNSERGPELWAFMRNLCLHPGTVLRPVFEKQERSAAGDLLFTGLVLEIAGSLRSLFVLLSYNLYHDEQTGPKLQLVIAENAYEADMFLKGHYGGSHWHLGSAVGGRAALWHYYRESLVFFNENPPDYHFRLMHIKYARGCYCSFYEGP